MYVSGFFLLKYTNILNILCQRHLSPLFATQAQHFVLSFPPALILNPARILDLSFGTIALYLSIPHLSRLPLFGSVPP